MWLFELAIWLAWIGLFLLIAASTAAVTEALSSDDPVKRAGTSRVLTSVHLTASSNMVELQDFDDAKETFDRGEIALHHVPHPKTN